MILFSTSLRPWSSYIHLSSTWHDDTCLCDQFVVSSDRIWLTFLTWLASSFDSSYLSSWVAGVTVVNTMSGPPCTFLPFQAPSHSLCPQPVPTTCLRDFSIPLPKPCLDYLKSCVYSALVSFTASWGVGPKPPASKSPMEPVKMPNPGTEGVHRVRTSRGRWQYRYILEADAALGTPRLWEAPWQQQLVTELWCQLAKSQNGERLLA
jgi:hypothetical protein